MKRLKREYFTLIMMIGLSASLSFGQQKLAQTGFDFLSISSDAKAGAMGDAVNSLFGYSGALSHNPATMAEIPNFFTADISVNNWIADIKYLSCDAIFSPWSGDYGVIGLSFQSIDYGDVLGTSVANNSNGYIDNGNLNPAAMAIGIGYAKMISDRFAVGAQVKFAYQSLGKSAIPTDANTLITKQNVASTVAFDFGTNFKTGIKSLVFGMSVRNFSSDVTYEEESFQLPLLFTVGLSANILDYFEMQGSNQSFILSCDLTHPVDHPEQIKIGAEYQFMKTIYIRGGYISGDDEDGLTYGLGISSSGLGIQSPNLQIDYSYTPFGVFNNVQRFTVSFSM